MLNCVKVLIDGYEKERKAGIAEGIEKGIAKGRKSGIAEGRKSGLADGRKFGIIEGRKSGIAEEKSKTAKKLLNLGVDIDKISQATGLTEKEIMALN